MNRCPLIVAKQLCERELALLNEQLLEIRANSRQLRAEDRAFVLRRDWMMTTASLLERRSLLVRLMEAGHAESACLKARKRVRKVLAALAELDRAAK